MVAGLMTATVWAGRPANYLYSYRDLLDSFFQESRHCSAWCPTQTVPTEAKPDRLSPQLSLAVLHWPCHACATRPEEKKGAERRFEVPSLSAWKSCKNCKLWQSWRWEILNRKIIYRIYFWNKPKEAAETQNVWGKFIIWHIIYFSAYKSN